jgi:predicted deacylase
MAKSIRVGEISAELGETRWGPGTWVELRDGTRVGLPVIVVNGRESGPKVVLCGATHSTELSGTATIQALVRKKIDPSRLKGSIVAFPTANPLGMQFGGYTSPHDGANLAVSYPGSVDGTITSRIAHFIWNEASLGADLIMDLHENVSPCLMFTLVGSCQNKEVERRTVGLADAFGLTVIRTAPVDLGTPGMKAGDLYWAELGMANGIPGLTVELEGKFESRFDENQPVVRIGIRGVMNTLRSLGMIQGKIEPQTETPVLKGNFMSYGVVRANKGGLVNRFVEAGTKLRKGTRIAEVINPYGDVVEAIEMPTDGYIWAWTIIGPDNPNWCVQAGSPVAYLFSER